MHSSRIVLFAAMLGVAAGLPAQLAGTYTVGPAGSYPNIAAAIADLTSQGVVAPVTFMVLANDTGPWTIGGFTGQGPSNPVTFDGLGTVTLSGAQPMLTLTGCASVTIRGFNATFTSNVNICVVNAGTTDCVFAACDFRTNVTTTGVTSGVNAVFNFVGGSGCRIEDSTFGGSYESLYSSINNSNTTVQRCKILGGGFWIMRLAGSNFTLANNFITGTSNYGISAGVSGAANGPNLKILHNSIFINHATSGSQYCSLRWYSNAPGSEVVNNIFCDNYPTLTTTTFNVWCLSAVRPASMNYNCFWSNQAGYVPVFATANRTLAAWQLLGFDFSSLQTDPQYVAPGSTVAADLSLLPGSPCSATGTTLAGVLTDYFLYPRTPLRVSIGAHEQDIGYGASYQLFGRGCTGTAGVPTNSASTYPRLGANPTITFGTLPAPYLAIAVIGLSNTVSTMGALPLDMTVLGAPACWGHISPDATMFLLGAAGSASFSLSIPNDASYLGMPIFTQAVVLDATNNALGVSMSHAAAATIGS